jgi:hypothetical protein
MTHEQKAKRAKSNILAACKVIGMTGVLDLLTRHCDNTAVQMQSGASVKHWTNLGSIFLNAEVMFRAECDRHEAEVHVMLPSLKVERTK